MLCTFFKPDDGAWWWSSQGSHQPGPCAELCSNNAAGNLTLLQQAGAHFTLAHYSVGAALLSTAKAIHHEAICGYGIRVSTLATAYCAGFPPAGNVQLSLLATDTPRMVGRSEGPVPRRRCGAVDIAAARFLIHLLDDLNTARRCVRPRDAVHTSAC